MGEVEENRSVTEQSLTARYYVERPRWLTILGYNNSATGFIENNERALYTVCSLFNEDQELISRGISICSLSDIFDEENGRKRAYGRAMDAFHKNEETSKTPNQTGKIIPSRFVVTPLAFYNNESMELKRIQTGELAKAGIEYKEFTDNSILALIPEDYPSIATLRRFSYKSEYNPTPVYINVSRRPKIGTLEHERMITGDNDVYKMYELYNTSKLVNKSFMKEMKIFFENEFRKRYVKHTIIV